MPRGEFGVGGGEKREYPIEFIVVIEPYLPFPLFIVLLDYQYQLRHFPAIVFLGGIRPLISSAPIPGEKRGEYKNGNQGK